MVVYLLAGEGEQSRVLLGHKGRGLGQGRIVGPGGKVTPGETPKAAAVREVAEEVGIVVAPSDLHHRATISYPFVDRPENSQRSFVFTSRQFQGEPSATDELDPKWYLLGEIPWDQMWDDAKRWLPRVFAGEFVEATFTIGPDDRVACESWSHG